MSFDRSDTFYLFARPSLLDGVARVIDIGGTFDAYNEAATPKDADVRATLHDWAMVGVDLRGAIEQYEEQSKNA